VSDTPTDPNPDSDLFHEWLETGIALGYCTRPVCATHDGLPSTDEEDAEWEDGYDPCVAAVRLCP